jgi:hypothetical protein
MIDQEISLFYDHSPMLTIAELEAALPESDDLWLATDASTWRQVWTKEYGSDVYDPSFLDLQQHSLRELFQILLEEKVDRWDDKLQILHMRLLLYPIHILVCQLCQLITCLPDTRSANRFPRSACVTSSTLQLNEIKCLLRSWWDMFDGLSPNNVRQRALKQVTLILYHLINLNLFVSIPDIERFARGELRQPANKNNDNSTQVFSDSFIRAREEALFHCGQTLRVMRGIEAELRPLWWPVAIYRVAITLWAFSVSPASFRPQPLPSITRISPGSGEAPAVEIAIDALLPSDPAWRQFFKYKRGSPRLTAKDGSLVPIEDPGRVLSVCIEFLNLGQGMSCLAEGVACKLESLAKGYYVVAVN